MADIEYFYSAHSYYAYLGHARLMEIARVASRQIVHKPFYLEAAVEAAGSIPFKERSKTLMRYHFKREAERWAEERNVPVMARRPTYHDADMTLPSGLLIAAANRGLDVDQLALAVLAAHWTEDADIADAAALAGIAGASGMDPETLLAEAGSQEVLTQYMANTKEAVERGVLGSPTYFVDGDPFYGQDRLEMVERALKRPYKAVTFTR